ncbi:MAG TPA: ATP-binding protein [Planctomycetes bacterium]|nr:ATP-binding protein [Planctomycetota bacterium]
MAELIHREIVIPNDTAYLADVRKLVHEVVEKSSFPSEEAHRIILAVDEAVTNIMQHAYEHDLEGSLEIELVLEVDNTKFEVAIRDSGKSFDPQDVDAPDIDKHVKNGKRHGLGIFLIRQIMDEVVYSYKQGVRNELRMVKYARGAKKTKENRTG